MLHENLWFASDGSIKTNKVLFDLSWNHSLFVSNKSNLPSKIVMMFILIGADI